MSMRNFFIKNLILAILSILGTFSLAIAQNKAPKILVIGVDGIINTALDYATTPSIDQIVSNAAYSMNGYSNVPAYSNTGWSTMLTGVSPSKHGVNSKDSFEGNQFSKFPSVVSRIKTANANFKIASVVRTEDINLELNKAADYKFSYETDQEVANKAAELLGQTDIGAVFVQFSSPAEVGKKVGYQLREAQYVLAIQQIDQHIGKLMTAVNARGSLDNENWAIFLASSHGGTETGAQNNNSAEEFNVPVILSGGGMDKKELISTALSARENNDNILTVSKANSGEKTFVRTPIAGTPLQGMNKFTIEMWIKPGANSSDPSIIGDKDWGSGGNPGFTLCRSGTSWKINIASVKRERNDIGSTKTLEDGNWHHIAVTFDKTNECIVYQDGVKMAEAKLTYKPEDSMLSPYDYIILAQDGTGNYGSGGPNWAGSYNEVRIWTEALSQETLKNYMYLNDIEKSNHPNLSALNLYYKFDEARGNTIQDHSGKGHHGEVVGPATSRHPHYPISLADVAINVLSHVGVRPDGSWGLEGNTLKSNVPFRLFKVN